MTLTDSPPYVTRLASEDDLGLLCGAFMAMLQELEPLGHDIKPTIENVAIMSKLVLGPALHAGDHGIFIAEEDGELVAATFFTPTQSPFQLRSHQAIAYGIWVKPSHRRKGLALLLQDQAHQRLKDLGYEELISIVVRDNEAGMASARAAGAQIAGYFTTVKLRGGC